MKSAESTFDEIRKIDKHTIDGMDQYAYLIYRRRDRSKLNKLSNGLLSLNNQCSETWISVALLCQITGEKDKCLSYLSKAAGLGTNNAFVHKVQGWIYQESGRPQHAAMCFFRALERSRDLESLEGLVDAYISCEKYKEAIVAAKNAIQMAPNNAKALTLVGVAFAKGSPAREVKERAKKALLKALSLDPSCLRALLTLVNLHLQDSDCDTCVELLTEGMENLHTNEHDLPLLHTKLGNVYAMKHDYDNALKHYQAAITLKPNDTSAQQGLDRLEKMMGSGGTYSGDSFAVESIDD